MARWARRYNRTRIHYSIMIHSFPQMGSALGWQDVLSGGSFQEGQAGKGCQPNTSSEAREQVITPKSSHLMRPSEVHRISSLYHPFGDQQYSSALDGGEGWRSVYEGSQKGSCVECLVPTINGSNRWRCLDDKHTTPVDKFIDKLLLKGTRCEVTQIITGCVIWRVCLSQAPCSFYFLAVVEWAPLPHRVLCHSGLLWHSGLLPP